MDHPGVSGVIYKPDDLTSKGQQGVVPAKTWEVWVPVTHNAKSEIPNDPEGVLQRLRQTALRITSRSQTSRERALIKMISALDSMPAERQQKPHQPCDTPPVEVVRALRSPAGTQQLVVTHVAGRRLRVVINPLGRPDPEREAAVWQCLRDLTEEHAA